MGVMYFVFMIVIVGAFALVGWKKEDAKVETYKVCVSEHSPQECEGILKDGKR